MFWTGWVISALPILLLTMSMVMKFRLPEDAVKGFQEMGWKQEYAVYLGVTELICVVLYAIPPTAVLGAILVTGYLGGAVATHARLGDLNLITPAAFGVLAWLGLYLREPRLRALIPLRR
jgi:hypothetical protein